MSVLHHNLIRALRDAGPEGLSEGDMAQAGGRWWKRHVTDINRWKLAVIGWEEINGEKCYFDASGVEQSDGAKPVEGTPVESAVGLLSTDGDDPSVEAELTLFPSRGRSPYDLDEAA